MNQKQISKKATTTSTLDVIGGVVTCPTTPKDDNQVTDWESFDTDLVVCDESESSLSSRFRQLKTSYNFSTCVQLQKIRNGHFIRKSFNLEEFMSIADKSISFKKGRRRADKKDTRQTSGVVEYEGTRLNFPDSLNCLATRPMQ